MRGGKGEKQIKAEIYAWFWKTIYDVTKFSLINDRAFLMSVT